MAQAINGAADQLSQFLSKQIGSSPIQVEETKKQEKITGQINKEENFAEILADQISQDDGVSARNSRQENISLSELAEVNQQQADAYLYQANQKVVANASRVSGASSQIDKQELSDKFLAPSAANLARLSTNTSERIGQVLDQYNIPTAPTKITFDDQGQIQFPEDYVYEDQFRAALEDNPGLLRELSDINALASHYVGINQASSLSQALSQVSSKQEEAAIIAKYSHLFNNNSPSADIALNFTKDGTLSLTANNKPL